MGMGGRRDGWGQMGDREREGRRRVLPPQQRGCPPAMSTEAARLRDPPLSQEREGSEESGMNESGESDESRNLSLSRVGAGARAAAGAGSRKRLKPMFPMSLAGSLFLHAPSLA